MGSLKRYAVSLIILVSIILSGCTRAGNSPADPAGESGQLQVHFLDVGQADCILIISPGGKSVLIDGGNNEDGPEVVSYLKAQGVKELEGLIATHPHEDHIGGLDQVLQGIPTKNVYLPDVTANTRTFAEFISAVESSGARRIQAKEGVQLAIPDCTGMFLAPNQNHYEDLNNYSAVLKLTYGRISFLFTGDAEDLSEAEMLKKGRDLKATVLKVGHHGSSSSTTEEFLGVVSPQYAVISVGADNDYGHPAPTVLKRLNEAGARVYRTDLSGTIVAKTDGESIQFSARTQDTEAKPGSGSQQAESAGQSMVELSAIDLKEEIAVVTNRSNTEVNLTGWKLVSEVGNQTFVFPDGTILPAGKSLKIVSGEKAQAGAGTLLWTKSQIWNNQGDPGALYNAQGDLIGKR